MNVEIDPEVLSDDERYHLTQGLESLKTLSPSAQVLLNRLRKIANAEYNKMCKKYGWSLML